MSAKDFAMEPRCPDSENEDEEDAESISSSEESSDCISTSEESSRDHTSSSDEEYFDESSSESEIEESSLSAELAKAKKNPLFRYLSAAFRIIALQAAGEEKEIQNVKKQKPGNWSHINSLDERIESRLKLARSQAWCKRASTAIQRYPEFVKELDRDELAGGDFMLLDDCEVCNRDKHPWQYKVAFKGHPYNRTTFIQDDSQDEDLYEPDLNFKMGKFCFERTKVYHALYHWKYHLYRTMKEKLSNVDLKTVQKDKHLLLKTYKKLKLWMHRVTQDYTLDGKSERGNRKWQREHAALYT